MFSIALLAVEAEGGVALFMHAIAAESAIGI
jgi:hypothetical protein